VAHLLPPLCAGLNVALLRKHSGTQHAWTSHIRGRMAGSPDLLLRVVQTQHAGVELCRQVCSVHGTVHGTVTASA
jgi:hypothetical protein